MRKLLLVIVFILLLTNISAICNETQINVNSASTEELDSLAGIGPVYALRIIERRPFGSVDDLINVSGIGPATLEKIKQQGLACVNEEDVEPLQTENIENENNSTEEEPENTATDEEIEEKEDFIYENLSQGISEKTELVPIILNSKNIKSEDNKENLKRNLALGGIITFCIMFGALFLLKTRKRKNEFQ